jgi:hypothetical protein
VKIALASSFSTYRIHALFFEIGNCLDITIMFDLFMTTALMEECLIELHQQGLADADSALQLTKSFCSVQMFSSAHLVGRRRCDNQTTASTDQLVGRLRPLSTLLIPFRCSRVLGLFAHSPHALQQQRHAGENL